jgi:hypothetical protein
MAVCARLGAVLRAILVLHSTDGDDDGRELNLEARRGYEAVLELASGAGLLSADERRTLDEVISRWGRHPSVVRELLSCFVSEVIEAARGPGLAAVGDVFDRQRHPD